MTRSERAILDAILAEREFCWVVSICSAMAKFDYYAERFVKAVRAELEAKWKGKNFRLWG